MFCVNIVKQEGKVTSDGTRLPIRVTSRWHSPSSIFGVRFSPNLPSLSNVISDDEIAFYNHPCYNNGLYSRLNNTAQRNAFFSVPVVTDNSLRLPSETIFPQLSARAGQETIFLDWSQTSQVLLEKHW